MNYYKIRDRKTGLFSTGGSSPRWVKGGKLWKGTGPLRAHLKVWSWEEYATKRPIPDNWDVIEYQISETGVILSAKGEYERPSKK